ncbi:uncharacterized protein LOC120334479 isoform X2 [Styela clava]
MDSCNLLESKITHFTSYDDISFYLGSNVSNCPQKISNNFVKNFGVLIDQAIQGENLRNVGVVVQVFNYLLQQNQPDTIQVLISCGFHEQFDLMLGFAFSQVSLKKSQKPDGDQLYLNLLRLIVDYCGRMNDHFNWFFQNLLQKISSIISDCTVYYVIRMQTAEKFLEIFSDEDTEVVGFLRNSIEQNVEVYDQIWEKAFKSLPHVGDFQLQKSIVEIILRVWPTDVRESKMSNWCDGNQQLLTKFLAISHAKFDYGVRMFLNDVNSSSATRRILTLNYIELQIGEQTLVPCNQWKNCVDFCYESKKLSITFPDKESSEQHKGSWITDFIEGADLVSFTTSENPAMRSLDLHIEFDSFTSQVLKEFELIDELSTNLIIRFYRVAPLDASQLLKFTSCLFGSNTYLTKQRRRGFVSRPQAMLIMNQGHSQHSDHASRNNPLFTNIPEALPPSQPGDSTEQKKLEIHVFEKPIETVRDAPTCMDENPVLIPSPDQLVKICQRRKSQGARLLETSSSSESERSQRSKLSSILLRDFRKTPATSSKPHQGSISSQVIGENQPASSVTHSASMIRNLPRSSKSESKNDLVVVNDSIAPESQSQVLSAVVTSQNANSRKILKKERPKVSFDRPKVFPDVYDFGLNSEENEVPIISPRKKGVPVISLRKKGKNKKFKRKKKTKLFDFYSDDSSSTSDTSSDPGWLKEHIRKMETGESPKRIKTYLKKDNPNLSPLYVRTNYNMQDISTSSSNDSASSPEVVRSEVTYTSLMEWPSGKPKTCSFARACNLTFNDIVGDEKNDPTHISKTFEVSPFEDSDLSLPDFDSFPKATKESGRKNTPEVGELARVNNNTPSTSSAGMTIKEKKTYRERWNQGHLQ